MGMGGRRLPLSFPLPHLNRPTQQGHEFFLMSPWGGGVCSSARHPVLSGDRPLWPHKQE